jgi:hypothetical protein
LENLSTSETYNLQFKILNYQSVDGGVLGNWSTANFSDVIIGYHGQVAQNNVPEIPAGAYPVLLAGIMFGVFILRKRLAKKPAAEDSPKP